MITEQDLHEAIAECEGQRNPNSSTCLKLASYYTILEHMKGDKPMQSYSFASGNDSNTVNIDSDSHFARMVNGRDLTEVWKIIDELMDALQIVNPRLYSSVLRKLG